MIKQLILLAILISVATLSLAAQGSSLASVLYISQNIPNKMEVGGVYPVEIQVKNVGSSPWKPNDNIELVIQPPGNNESWGVERIKLSNEKLIQPGEKKRFKIKVTAPLKPNTYRFSWIILRDGVVLTGTISPAIPIVVGDPFSRSKFVSQIMPDRVNPGEKFKTIIQFKNSGKSSWSQQQGYKLAALTPNAKDIWGSNAIEIGSRKPILPDSTLTFSFQLRAPTKPGHYDVQWQMYQNDKRWFGEPTANVRVTVGEPEPHPVTLDLKSEFISQLIPQSMTLNQSYTVIVMFKNKGSARWRSQDVSLVSQSPDENLTWFISKVDIEPGSTVEPGEIKVFRFNVQTPADPGNYDFQWQLSHRRTGLFGDKSENLTISITP